jgi:predicted MPP superfamily phosphohydrolase
VAQWRIGTLWMRGAAKRGIPAWRAGAIFAAYSLLLAAAILTGFPQFAVPMHVNRWTTAVVGGAAQIWGYSSAAAYVIYEVVRFLRTRVAPRPFDPSRRKLINTASGIVVASPLMAVGYGALVERTRFHIREVEIPIPNLPPSLDGLRLVQLSDIHLSAFLSEQELERVIDMANETRPHVAVVTGDMISTRGDPLEACLRQLARLRSDSGTVACMGNHEDYAHAKDYATREGARLGVRFLRKQTEAMRFGNATVNFAGVDYQSISKKRDYLEGAEAMVLPGAFNVLLSHNPDVFPVAARKGYDLTLSGHTHGGQVTVEILDQTLNPARFLTPYVYGVYQRDGRAAYVTRGIGTIGIPARIGAPPEVALIRLKRA